MNLSISAGMRRKKHAKVRVEVSTGIMEDYVIDLTRRGMILGSLGAAMARIDMGKADDTQVPTGGQLPKTITIRVSAMLTPGAVKALPQGNKIDPKPNVQDLLDKLLDKVDGKLTVKSLPGMCKLEGFETIFRQLSTESELTKFQSELEKARHEVPKKWVISANLTIGQGLDFDSLLKTMKDVGIELLAWDFPIASAMWAPATRFGTRSQAAKLIGKDALHKEGLLGEDVNVVIVDQGFDKSLVKALLSDRGYSLENTFPGGFSLQGQNYEPGQGKSIHAAMIACSILDIAPKARIWDCPLIPQAQTGRQPSVDYNLSGFLSDIMGVCEEAKLVLPKLNQYLPGPWVFVNPWSLFDSRGEDEVAAQFPLSFLANAKNAHFFYTDDAQHPLNQTISELISLSGVNPPVDLIFSAGNGGQFEPDPRCGPDDRGPGSSIFGANSIKNVITVGAVRTDATWLGYSSQGPGKLEPQKPDLCAPSQFSEDDDAFAINSGTSAAAGLTAGIVAALRSKNSRAHGYTPEKLRLRLIESARKVGVSDWDGRFGHGILDGAAFTRLI